MSSAAVRSPSVQNVQNVDQLNGEVSGGEGNANGDGGARAGGTASGRRLGKFYAGRSTCPTEFAKRKLEDEFDDADILRFEEEAKCAVQEHRDMEIQIADLQQRLQRRDEELDQLRAVLAREQPAVAAYFAVLEAKWEEKFTAQAAQNAKENAKTKAEAAKMKTEMAKLKRENAERKDEIKELKKWKVELTAQAKRALPDDLFQFLFGSVPNESITERFRNAFAGCFK